MYGFSKRQCLSVYFLLLALLIPLVISGVTFSKTNIMNIEGNCNRESEGLENQEIAKMKQHLKEMRNHVSTAPEHATK
jgi:hypothetical protein